MDAISRQKRVLEVLKHDGNVNTTAMAHELGVSTMTIRRDLAKFAEQGLVTIEHGGAVLVQKALFEQGIAIKQTTRQEEKDQIAQRCIEFIKPGDAIFLDAGTTGNELAKAVAGFENLTVLTHSLLVANTLAHSPGVRLVICPGEFRETSMAFMGQMTDDFVSRFRIDVLFLGVEGVSLEGGCSVPDIADGETKRALVAQSNKVICMADSSKIEQDTFYHICAVADVTALVTDSEVKEDTANEYRRAGVNIVIA